MSRTTARVLALLLAGALPPLIAFAAVNTLASGLVVRLGSGTALAIAALLTLGWIALVATVASRSFAGEEERLLRVARHGADRRSDDPLVDQSDNVQRRLASALEERNSQIAELAARSRNTPIDLDAGTVARAMVQAARSITGDPTWQLAVMSSSPGSALVPGIYGPEADIAGIGEVHRWATTTERRPDEVVSFATGPWGAFLTATVARSDELRATLIAPREGRGAPSRAEQELVGLIAQHAGMAVEHALLYARIRAQAAELDRLAELQNDFLRGVTHDLQTPLTSIRALAEEARATPGGSDQLRADLDTIAHQADRLRRMVAQLLVMSRLEAGEISPRTDAFRVSQLVERTWAALRASHRIHMSANDHEHLAIGDPDRFEQAAWAILDNAVKYSPPGSQIDVTIEALDSTTLALTVTDRGRGMAPETVARAFDRFYRSADARAAVPNGSGIGLYTAKGLLRAMGGDITITSRLGNGSTVEVHVPAERATTA